MSKVSVIGAGNVGATCANVLAFREIADEVVLLDIKEGVSQGYGYDAGCCNGRFRIAYQRCDQQL